ncbi:MULTISPECIES: DUF1579 family protein [unclassified Pseudarthrobacter]|uniref:DUF1579 family protein n=1 Tax=unclassified Pseudarthrobacter TaxID=2647000 RepID=UPI0036333804
MNVLRLGHDGAADAPRPGVPAGIHPALAGLLGAWRGSTELAAGPWGPRRTVDAEVAYRRAAGGFAVVQSYRHVEADGSHFEGHGVFTLDPDHHDVFWYYVDSTGGPPGSPSRCTWHDGVLRVERRAGTGWTRHSIILTGPADFETGSAVLVHITELRTGLEPHAVDETKASANGKRPAFTPFMTSTFRRT